MPKFNCELAMLTRQSRSVVVEAQDEVEARYALGEIYAMVDGEDFTEDFDYCEEGSHYVHGEAEDQDLPEFRVLEDGLVVEVRPTPGDVEAVLDAYVRDKGLSDEEGVLLLCEYIARTDPQGLKDFLANGGTFQ
jgi:hypothetical protein